MTTAAFQPAADLGSVSRVHPAAPLLRALAVFIAGYVVYRLTGALADGSVLIPSGTRANPYTVALTQPAALAAFGLCIYPLSLMLGLAGLKPALLGRAGFVRAGIGAVVLSFAAYVALSFYL